MRRLAPAETDSNKGQRYSEETSATEASRLPLFAPLLSGLLSRFLEIILIELLHRETSRLRRDAIRALVSGSRVSCPLPCDRSWKRANVTGQSSAVKH
jgi:hypothetical protein